MQLSVIPHLTIYGDVKPEQIKKGFLRGSLEKAGLLLGPGEAAKTTEVALTAEQRSLVELTQ